MTLIKLARHLLKSILYLKIYVSSPFASAHDTSNYFSSVIGREVNSFTAPLHPALYC